MGATELLLIFYAIWWMIWIFKGSSIDGNFSKEQC